MVGIGRILIPDLGTKLRDWLDFVLRDWLVLCLDWLGFNSHIG